VATVALAVPAHLVLLLGLLRVTDSEGFRARTPNLCQGLGFWLLVWAAAMSKWAYSLKTRMQPGARDGNGRRRRSGFGDG
jgi:hypothetical protein